jgi:hypothetical protein
LPYNTRDTRDTRDTRETRGTSVEDRGLTSLIGKTGLCIAVAVHLASVMRGSSGCEVNWNRLNSEYWTDSCSTVLSCLICLGWKAVRKTF